MSIIDDVKKLFNPAPLNLDLEKEEFAIPAMIKPEIKIPVLPSDLPLAERFDPSYPGRKLKNFWSMDQKDNSVLWAQEIGVKGEEKIPWNSCMTSSFADFFLSVINTFSIAFWPNKERFVLFRDLFNKDTIEKWYYQELMIRIAQTPQPDHRWQATAHATMINHILDECNRPDIRLVITDSSIEAMKANLDMGFPYPAGTWETWCGHIICFNAYKSDLSEFEAGNPFGKWTGKLNQYVNGSTGPHKYSRQAVEYLFGKKLNGWPAPAGYGRTWGCSVQIRKV